MLDIVHAPPGRRFQDRYQRRSASERGRIARWAMILAGIGLTLVGIVFLAIPGPGIPILAVGLALIAQESAATARLLDRAELWIRARLARRFPSYRGRGSRTR